MGQFSTAVQSNKASTIYEQVVAALASIGDGSEREFLIALVNKGISAPSLVEAIKSTTGINVSQTTVERWRKRDRSGQVRE